MLGTILEDFEREVAVVVSAMKVHAGVREMLSRRTPDGNSYVNTGELENLRGVAPISTEWKVYDHCAAFTRLYALYERFICDVVRRWLLELARTTPEYANLPVCVRDAHRSGVAGVLGKWGPNSRYGDLSEMDIVGGLYDGICGKSPYVLMPDAFLLGESNFRLGRLVEIFSGVGINNCDYWMRNHQAVKAALDVQEETWTIEEALKDFVFRRNGASHGDVDDILGPERFELIAHLICGVARAVAQMTSWHHTANSIGAGLACVVGRVEDRFKGGKLVITCSTHELKRGDRLAFFRDCDWSIGTIASIQLDDVDVPSIVNAGDREIGLKLDGESPKKYSRVALFLPVTQPAARGNAAAPTTNAVPAPVNRGSTRRGSKVPVKTKSGLAWLASFGQWCIEFARKS